MPLSAEEAVIIRRSHAAAVAQLVTPNPLERVGFGVGDVPSWSRGAQPNADPLEGLLRYPPFEDLCDAREVVE